MNKRYPFKFLDAYESEDAKFYFGRDAEIEQLYEMVFQTNLLMVYGTSGTGKTSLINCGLASKFQSHDWDEIEVRRGQNINDSLERVLAEKCKLIPEEAEDSENWLDDLNSEDSAIAEKPRLSTTQRALQKIYLNSFKPIYLIFDQFEELFILGDEEERDQFLTTLTEITNFNYPVTSIIVTREEYLGHFYKFEKRLPQLFQKKLRVEPMTITNLKSVIVGISNAVESNVYVKKGEEDAVTDLIFNKLRSKKKINAIQLPYLQVFLDKLYLNITNDEKREQEATISIEEVQQIGDIEDVLKDFLITQVDTISKQLTDENPTSPVSVENIWSVLLPLTTKEGTKEPLSEAQLFEKIAGVSQESTRKIIDSCSKNRILRHNDESDVYEVAHDALALTISSKRSDSDVALLEIREMINNKMALGSKSDDFFTQKQIDLIEPFLKYYLLKLSPEEEDLLQRSKDQIAKSKRTRIRNLVLIGIGILGIISLSTYMIIVNQRIDATNSLNLIHEHNIHLREIITAEKFIRDSIPIKDIADYPFINSEPIYSHQEDGKIVRIYSIKPDLRNIDTKDWLGVMYKLTVDDANTAGPGGSKAEMLNSIFLTGRDKQFKMTYSGYACVKDIVALIEFKNPDRSSEFVLWDGTLGINCIPK